MSHAKLLFGHYKGYPSWAVCTTPESWPATKFGRGPQSHVMGQHLAELLILGIVLAGMAGHAMLGHGILL